MSNISVLKQKKPYMIAIVGGTASGKSTFTNKLKNELENEIVHFGLDNFYIGIPSHIDPDNYDFDHPESLDWDYIHKCLSELITNGFTESPVYDFTVHARIPDKTIKVISKPIIIVEGILCLYDQRIRDLFDLKIFINCDNDIALGRRILRDISERGRDVNEVLRRYTKFVKPDYENFVKPQMKYVDLIIPGGANNEIALIFVVDHLIHKLKREKNIKNEITSNAVKSNLNVEESRSRKFSVKSNSNIKYNADEGVVLLNYCVKKNHISLSEELKNTVSSFYKQVFTNPDEKMIRMNMEYLFYRSKSEVLAAMRSDFQMEESEISKLLIKVKIDTNLEELSTKENNKKIYLLKNRSILDQQTFEKILFLLKQLDDFPVYLHVDFIDKKHAELICDKSPNTHLFALFCLESGQEFLESLSENIQNALFKKEFF